MQTNTAEEYSPTPAEREAAELETALYYLATRVVVADMAVTPPKGGFTFSNRWSPELERAAAILKRRGVIDLYAFADRVFDNAD